MALLNLILINTLTSFQKAKNCKNMNFTGRPVDSPYISKIDPDLLTRQIV